VNELAALEIALALLAKRKKERNTKAIPELASSFA